MRFSAPLTPAQPMLPSAVDALLRRLQGEAVALPADSQPAPLRELPDDLDQRVRQTGEW